MARLTSLFIVLLCIHHISINLFRVPLVTERSSDDNDL